MISKFFILQLFIIIHIAICQNKKCSDESCNSCSMDGLYCFQCKPGFTRHYNKCGKVCSSIVNCRLCDASEKNCIRCKSNCVFNGIQCDCTERYVLAAVCLFFSIFMILLFFICLLHSSWRNFYQNSSILSGRIAPSILNRSDISRISSPYYMFKL